MEEDISDAIYGDLGDFEFNEKLKENCQKIEDLMDQLNQSKNTIAGLEAQMKDLSKLYRELKKNSSSLLVTARTEIDRKDRNIGLLQQKIDNRAFRRPNKICSIGIQTDVESDPIISRCNGRNDDYGNGSEQLLHQPVSDLSKFRIPKKNPFARHENDQEDRYQISACNEKVKEHGHDEPIRQLSKKNPHERHYEDRDRSKDRRDEIRSSRRPFTNNSQGLRDYKERDSKSNDRKCDRSGNNRKRGRSSSDEMDRHAKRRSDPSPSRQRSRSRPTRNEEKLAKAKSPIKRQLKCGKGDRNDEMKSRKESVTNLKEKDLEAILIAQKKILDEINSKENCGLPEKPLKEHRERKNSTMDNRATMTTIQERHLSEQQEHRKRVSSTDDDLDHATSTTNHEGQPTELSEKSPKAHRKRKNSKNEDHDTIATIQEIQSSEQQEHRQRVGSTNDDLDHAIVTTNPERKMSELPEKSPKAHRKRKNSKNEDHDTIATIQEIQSSEQQEHRQRVGSTNDDLDHAIVTTNQERKMSELPEKSPREHRKRESTKNEDHATTTTNEVVNKDLSGANDACIIEEIAEPKLNTEILSVDNAVNPKTSNVIEARPDTIEVIPELQLLEATDFTNHLKQSSSEEAETPLESTNEKEIAGNVSGTAQLLNDEKSNSPMDIDYELMEHKTIETQTNLPMEETDPKTLAEDSPKTMTPDTNKDVTCDESSTAVEGPVQKDDSLSSTLNSSQERHILSKSSEYTVEDAGFEIRMFLTKKRKKNKKAKVIT